MIFLRLVIARRITLALKLDVSRPRRARPRRRGALAIPASGWWS